MWFLASRRSFYHQPSDGCKGKNKLFFGREFRRGIRPQKLLGRRIPASHLLEDCAGKVSVVFFVRYTLDLCGQRVRERNSFANAVGCAITRLALVLFHAGNRHTLSDGLQWVLFPITRPAGRGSLFELHTRYTRLLVLHSYEEDKQRPRTLAVLALSICLVRGSLGGVAYETV